MKVKLISEHKSKDVLAAWELFKKLNGTFDSFLSYPDEREGHAWVTVNDNEDYKLSLLAGLEMFEGAAENGVINNFADTLHIHAFYYGQTETGAPSGWCIWYVWIGRETNGDESLINLIKKSCTKLVEEGFDEHQRRIKEALAKEQESKE